MDWKSIITPFGKLSRRTYLIMVIVQVGLVLFLFEAFHSPIVPPPSEIFGSLVGLVQSTDFWNNAFNSLIVTIEAMSFSIILTGLIVYLSTIPFFKPLAQLISRLRYLTLTGLVYLFIVFTNDMGQLKLSLLMFGIVPYFTTSFLSTINAVPQQQLDKARVNRMTPWESLLEVIVIGKVDNLFEVMRQNFAISWMMITTVEAYDMSEGGIGTLFIKGNRAHDLPLLFAMLLVVLGIGLLTDFLLSWARTSLFKYL
jgi:ABC-type nitrate/sulfonate/bicarbonate transport system permease component